MAARWSFSCREEKKKVSLERIFIGAHAVRWVTEKSIFTESTKRNQKLEFLNYYELQL